MRSHHGKPRCRIHRPYRPYRLSEVMSFSLINVVQIFYPQNKNRPSICGGFKPSSFKLGLFVIKNLSTIIVMELCQKY